MMHRSKSPIIAALTALTTLSSLITTGCYGYYQPIAPNLTGHQLQLSITDSGSVVLAPQVGFQVDAVDGRLVREGVTRAFARGRPPALRPPRPSRPRPSPQRAAP